MKICVFGADGRTGVEVVRYAVSKSHQVVAFVYSAGAKSHLPDGITIKQGNVMDYDAVDDAVSGCDAVISALGHIKGSDPRMQTKGMANIVKAMQKRGIRRALSLTGTGAREKGDTPSFIDKMLTLIVGFVDPDRVADGVEHVQVLRNSGLDWTVVRVLKLSKSDAPCSSYRLTATGPAELQTSRKKVAMALVDQVGSTEYYGKLPVISG